MNITLDEEIPLGKAIGICQAMDEDLMNDLAFYLDPGNAYFAVDRSRSLWESSQGPLKVTVYCK